MGFTRYVENPNGANTQELRIDRHKGRISGKVTVLNYIDKETKQYVAYTPALEISGYGDTKQKAIEMLEFSIDQYFTYIIKLPIAKLNQEMIALGWHQNRIFNKRFSHAYVDVDGELKNLNAEGDKVEVATLTAA